MDIHIPAQSVPVLLDADVVVCGGGPAGIATAISAARHGARTVIVERWPSIGGMATNALVNGWHRSDREKVVIDGLVEESAQRAAKEGWIERDPQFPHAHETHWFDPEGMRIVWHRMLQEAGVRTLCHLKVGEAIVEDGRLRAVLVDSKRGRRAITGRIFVDASGDGDVAAAVGLPFAYGRDEDRLVQGMTLIFSLTGIDPAARAAAGPGAEQPVLARMEELRAAGAFPPFNAANCGHYLRNGTDRQLWNMLPVNGDPLDEEELTGLNVLARERLVAYLALWRKEMPGFARAAIDRTGYAMGVRESRRVLGRSTLDGQMVLSARKQADAIGHGVWMIDIHDPKGTGYTTYTDRKRKGCLATGTSYHIPLGMCLNERIANLAVVGRCASTTHEGLSSVRVQTHCMVMGQGVGTAAALALAAGTDIAGVPLPRLQRQLKADGVHLEDVPAA